MKKAVRNLAITLAAALTALALFGCGGSEKPVNYDGTYRCLIGEQYRFLVIKGDDMTAYTGDTDAFADAVKLVDGDFTLTVRNDEGITAVNDTLSALTTVYTAGSQDGVPTLIDEQRERTYVKIA